jgi:hypothetical protein
MPALASPAGVSYPRHLEPRVEPAQVFRIAREDDAAIAPAVRRRQDAAPRCVSSIIVLTVWISVGMSSRQMANNCSAFTWK